MAKELVRLAKKYREDVVPELKKKFGLKNALMVPRLDKIVINMGVGTAIADIKNLEAAVQDLASITGQKPQITRSKKAISNFKLREDAPIGCKVTLRKAKMYEFMDRLVNVSLPRIRDFNGISPKSFDKEGNYTMGLSEQNIFPEIDLGRIARPQGMDITFVFNKGPREQTFAVLQLLGMPFSKNSSNEKGS